MTEQRAPHPRAPVPPVRRTVAAGLAVFFAVMALLAWQVRTGRDPALARAATRPVVTSTPRRVLVRKVVRRIVIERVVHDDGVVTQQPVVATVVTHVPSTSRGTSSASSSAPAPAAAPAPAPAPQPSAPLVTRSS